MDSFLNSKSGKRVTNLVIVFLAVLSLFFLFKFINEVKSSSFVGREFGTQSTISVSGEGEVFATPDVASLTFAVSETADTVKKAQDAVTKRMNSILEFLDGKDIDDKDVKTTNYNIYPKYEWQQIQCFAYPCPPGKNILIGYEVRHNISLKVREINEVGEVLTGLGEMGATNVSGVSFSIDEEEELREEARALAIEDAQDKAEQLADELDVKLVRVISFFEQNAGVMLQRFEMMDSRAVGLGGASITPDIPVGENNLISRVNITYEIR